MDNDFWMVDLTLPQYMKNGVIGIKYHRVGGDGSGYNTSSRPIECLESLDSVRSVS